MKYLIIKAKPTQFRTFDVANSDKIETDLPEIETTLSEIESALTEIETTLQKIEIVPK